jgi:asparagine synthase (glutamine-hydrolysing)
VCGFLAYLSPSPDAAARAAAVGEAAQVLTHRGPDESGSWCDEHAALAFKRLSIVDLERSSQPLHYLGRYVVVFNGEIYNHAGLRAELAREYGAPFVTDGDTEVPVAAYHYWGEAALPRLRGMFAFVIWDRLERRAFAARDRFGIKPLCFVRTAAGVVAASEQKALLPFVSAAAGVGPDPAALSHYLTYQYVPEPLGLLGGIGHVGAGEAIRVDPAGAVERVRWARPQFRPQPPADPQGAIRAIRDALRDSVHAHLRADVPVGAFLSSGIDSTAVVAFAREVNPDLLTFTAALEVEGYSEAEVAQDSARRLGVHNQVVRVDAQMMMDALPRIVWHLDDPVADPALVPLYFVAREAARQVKVVVSGEGADELFAGYPIYREPLSLRPLTGLPGPIRAALRRVAGALPEGMRGRSLLERGATPIAERYYGNARMFTEDEKRALLRRYDPAVRYTDITAPLYARAAGVDGVAAMQFVDLGTWLPGDILRKADRMSMAHSLEVRVPFLDPAVFAAAEHLPTRMKLPARSQQTKLALRQALRGVVPDPIVDRVKLGFPTPIRVWLRAEMYEWAAAVLADSDARAVVDLDRGLELLRAHRAGPADHSRKIWTLLVFAIWYDVFVSKVRQPGIVMT